MSKELPGEWGKRLGPKGIHSYRDMADRVGGGVSAGTLHRLVTGKPTSAGTVNKVADSLFDGDRDLVWRLRGSRRRDYGDWSLPPEASLLTEEQRTAVLAVVQAMVPAEREGGGEGDTGGTPANTPPGSGPDRPPLLAVASGDEGDEKLAREATEQARKSRQEQLDAIAEMKRKQERKRDKGGDGR